MIDPIAKCPRCAGEGFLRVPPMVRVNGAHNPASQAFVRCPQCAGTGCVEADLQHHDPDEP
jgi:DnaJ-class molecular chaperone